jgi:hypothetical protein
MIAAHLFNPISTHEFEHGRRFDAPIDQVADGEKPVARRVVPAQFQFSSKPAKTAMQIAYDEVATGRVLFEASHGYESLLHVFTAMRLT